MAYDLSSITSSKKDTPPRIILLGVQKVGKSTFASKAPGAIFLPIKHEEGIDELDVQATPVIETYQDCLGWLDSLVVGNHEHQTVVIDSSSTLEPLIWDEVVASDPKASTIERVQGGFAKGYIEALKYWREVMSRLDALRARGMASIVIGHVIVKQFNDPMEDPYDKYHWDIHYKAAALWERWADCILFTKKEAYVTTKEESGKKIRKAVGEDKSKLYTQARPAHPGGGRGVYGHLPYELPLDWDTFMQAQKEAKGKTCQN